MSGQVWKLVLLMCVSYICLVESSSADMGSLAGKVVDYLDSDKGVADVKVTVDDSSEQNRYDYSDVNGDYQVDEITPGNVEIDYTSGDHLLSPDSQSCTVEPDKPTNVEDVFAVKKRAEGENRPEYAKRIANRIYELTDQGANHKRLQKEWRRIVSFGLPSEIEAHIAWELNRQVGRSFSQYVPEAKDYLIVKPEEIGRIEAQIKGRFRGTNATLPKKQTILNEIPRDIVKKIIRRNLDSPRIPASDKAEVRTQMEKTWGKDYTSSMWGTSSGGPR